MHDFLGYTLRRYYQLVGWDDDAGYANLCAWSDALLNFNVPGGLRLSVGRRVTPHLHSSHSLALAAPSRTGTNGIGIGGGGARASAGFLFFSPPIPPPPLLRLPPDSAAVPPRAAALPLPVPAPDDGREGVVVAVGGGDAADAGGAGGDGVEAPKRDGVYEEFWRRVGLSAQSRLGGGGGPYLLYGRVFDDFRIEGLYSRSLWGGRDMLVVSGMNAWAGDESQISAQYMHRGRGWFGEASYSSDDHVLGASALVRVPASPHWSVGAELFYTAKERSGGLSIGAKYEEIAPQPPQQQQPNGYGPPPVAASTVAFLANPMMGHLSTSYTATVLPGMAMAATYDLNAHSYASDLAVGVGYETRDGAHAVRARIGLESGLALKVEGRYGAALVAVGVSTTFSARPERTMGVEVGFF
ncbi:Mitochondrial distribution and morphology protein 10 [Cladochytrium tenue]|nr:Mitochondrial distribution and morphology protein 10 [Cladochytrium tenue]